MVLKLRYLLLLLVVFSLNAYSQTEETTASANEEIKPVEIEKSSSFDKGNYNSWALSFGAGNFYFSGDLSSVGAEDKSFDVAFNVGVTKMFNSSIGIEGVFTMGTAHMYASEYHVGKNTPLNGSTETPFFTTNLNLVINLSNLVMSGRDHANRRWNFNAYPGVGMTFHKAYFTAGDGSKFPDQDWANNANKDDEYVRVFSIPVALGVKYRLSRRFDIELRETATYYSDSNFDGRALYDVNNDYSAGGGRSDFSFYTGISFVWKLGSKDKYLDWTNPLDDTYLEIDNIKSRVDAMTSDVDGDGVSDMYDIDNETPAGVMVAGNGKALDSDQDGIPDYKDVDPFTPKGAEVDEYGKELDDDNDGVGNSIDAEPNTEEGAIVNWQGVTVGGGDAVASGVIPSVFFKFDSAALDSHSEDRLIIIAKIMKNNPNIKVDVVGYADQVGDPDYNKKLGEKRANAVVKFLTDAYGIDESRMTVKTEGADKPLSTSKKYYKNNRRVDFVIK